MKGDEDTWGIDKRVDPNPAETLRLRWFGQKIQAVRGEWQVMRFPPPSGTANWSQPPGLVARGSVPAPPEGDASLFDIPVKDILSPKVRAAGHRLCLPQVNVAADYYVRVVPLDKAGAPAGPASKTVLVHLKPPDKITI